MCCEDCRHWTTPDASEYIDGWRREFGKCVQTPHGEDVGEWDWESEDGTWAMAQEFADRTAIVQDASGYRAELYTKPEHFCAMFKSKVWP